MGGMEGGREGKSEGGGLCGCGGVGAETKKNKRRKGNDLATSK